jgi:hypothetical protein
MDTPDQKCVEQVKTYDLFRFGNSPALFNQAFETVTGLKIHYKII